MPLFQRHDPDLRSLIAYIVARARERDVTLTQTKLVKLLYLIDVERAASARPLLPGLHWVFFHYGPYALELPETLEQMEGGSEVVVGQWHNSKLYRAAPGAPTGEEWPSGTRSLVDSVLRRYASMELNELLDFVYFRTAPMRGAVRGKPLDMTQARTNPIPRPGAPLTAPTLPDGARNRMEEWRERRRTSYVPLSSEEQRSFLSDPEDEDLRLDSTFGRLVIPQDTEL
jgi:hypothetical protein